MKRIIKRLKSDWDKYLLETVVIVVGILVAFSLNAWNEDRKEDTLRKQLLIDLRSELQEKKATILPLIDLAQKYTNDSKRLHEIILRKDHNVPVDTLKSLTRSIIYGITYQLTLSAFDEARSSGRLSLINDKRVIEGYSHIFAAIEIFNIHSNTSAYMFYNGSTWELRKIVGDTDLLFELDGQISDTEYLELTRKLIFRSTVDNGYIMNRNILENLQEINRVITDVELILDQLKE